MGVPGIHYSREPPLDQANASLAGDFSDRTQRYRVAGEVSGRRTYPSRRTCCPHEFPRHGRLRPYLWIFRSAADDRARVRAGGEPHAIEAAYERALLRSEEHTSELQSRR